MTGMNLVDGRSLAVLLKVYVAQQTKE